MRVVVLDHYDSFTYNLVVFLEKLGASVIVLRTDASLDEIKRYNPTHIVLSPGPGHPKDVPLFQEVIEYFKIHIPILGVCLGHQAIGLNCGAEVEKSSAIMHGKVSSVTHNGVGIFQGILSPIKVCRYHSLAIVEKSIPRGTLIITARSEDGTIMSVESKKHSNVIGVQFHPESLFTEHGSALLQNFLKMEVRPA